MSSQRHLRQELDAAALRLLGKHFPKDSAEGAPPPDEGNQIKAFDAVVRYFGPRTKFGGDDDKQEPIIEQLRNKLHGRRAPRSNSNSSNGGGNSTEFPGFNDPGTGN